MVEVTVDANHLAPIVVINKKLEPIPDVFRLQEKVLFIVTLDEYIKFIELLNDEIDILPVKTNTLKEIVKNINREEDNESNEVTIKDIFYFNMSLALGKELHFSQVYGRNMSNYVAIPSNDAEPVNRDDLEFLYSLIEEDKKLIYQEHLNRRGYKLNVNKLTEQQEFYYKYAILCYNSFVIRNSNWCLNLN